MYQFLPVGNTQLKIDEKHRDSCPTNRCAADQDGTIPAKVTLPLVTAGIEETCQPPAVLRIEAGDVGTLEGIAVKAAQREVRWVGFATVLAGDDVVDLEGEEGVLLRQLTVFAAQLRA